MPLQACSADGKSGYRWGASGKCYAHDGTEAGKKAARKKAIAQGLAVGGGKLDASASAKTYTDGTRTFSKLCTGCGKVKGDQAFGHDQRTKDGLAKSCLTCASKSYALDTVDVSGVDIMAAGVVVHGGGSPPEGDTYTTEDLQALADASNAVCADLRPPVKIGHGKAQRLLANSGLLVDEQPAGGFLENFRVDGEKLLCDLKKVPRKLAELVEAGAFRFRSAELRPLRHQRTQKTYKAVVSGLALLGATPPAFQTLDDVHKLYAGVDAEPTGKLLMEDAREGLEEGTWAVDFAVGEVVWDEEQGVTDMMDDLRAALNPGVDSWRYSVIDLDPANTRALVCDYSAGMTWVVPYSLQAGEPVPAPGSDWTLVEKAWVQAEATAEAAPAVVETPSSGEYAEGGPDGPTAADTTAGMAEPQTKPAGDAPEIQLTDEQVKAFAELWDLGDDADAAKVAARAAELAKRPEVEPEPIVAGNTVKQDPAPTGRTLSEEEYASLRTMAEQGAAASESMRVSTRDGLLRDAARAGKILPASIRGFADKYDRDPSFVVELLESMPVNEEWRRVYGAEGDGLSGDGFDAAAERAYADYCAQSGIPYFAHPALNAGQG